MLFIAGHNPTISARAAGAVIFDRSLHRFGPRPECVLALSVRSPAPPIGYTCLRLFRRIKWLFGYSHLPRSSVLGFGGSCSTGTAGFETWPQRRMRPTGAATTRANCAKQSG